MNLGSFQKNTKVIGLFGLVALVLVGSVLVGRAVVPQFLAKAGSCPASGVAVAQLTGNSAVVRWDSEQISQGIVQYGTSATNLAFSSPEKTEGKLHNVPLTLLTPNTTYYYLVKVGDVTCDSSGQKCNEGSCVPWSFTTSGITPEAGPSPSLTPEATAAATPTTMAGAEPTAAASVTPAATTPTDKPVSVFCKQVQLSLGKTRLATDWATYKPYDIDDNGILNGKDVIRCIQTGR